MGSSPVIVAFRKDLRLSGNPALAAAIATGRPLIPLFVLDETEEPGFGDAAKWWLRRSLAALAFRLEARGSRLILRRGESAATVTALAAKSGATAIFWNRRYAPGEAASDQRLKAALTAAGLDVRSFNASLLREPWELHTQSGAPFRVFSPFWRALRVMGPAAAANARLPARFQAADYPESDSLEDWPLPKDPRWAAEFGELWSPGEAGAQAALETFLRGAANRYSDDRDRPDKDGTSRLSPHLAFGEIAPTAVWSAVTVKAAAREIEDTQAEKFLSELGWRDFSHHLLFHFPEMRDTPLRREFLHFPWGQDRQQSFDAWKKGLTGYPIVDAGMRQLWRTGWMHNRVRMIVASFLVKDLLVPWQEGEQWFWKTLLDADAASNAANWQWVAGCGADAAPYFRIFNPVTQGEKFDPQGGYVRQFVPELARLPCDFIHKPWTAPETVLERAGIALGHDYPRPIVDHADARKRALEAFAALKERSGNNALSPLY